MSMEIPLAINALSNVVFKDVAINCEGSLAPLTFKRLRPPTNFVKPIIFSGHLESPPPRPPSNLSSSSSENLQLTTTYKRGALIGAGHCGSVFSVKSPTIQNVSSTSATPAPHIPPLVIKVAARGRKKFLSREAWFYDEMESLQGIVVPRCYGWFAAELPLGWKFGPWRDNREDRERYTKSDINHLLDFHGPFVDSDAASHTVLERMNSDRCVMILVLERCGKEFLPLYKEIPDALTDDVYDAYEDLAELGIEHCDIRYANILKAPKSPPGLPSIASPYTSRTYGCRIIDFELARKVNSTMNRHRLNFEGWLEGVFMNLPYGEFCGQNEI